MNLTSIHKEMGSVPVPLSGLRIWHCLELWCRSQTQLGSGVAVAVVESSSYSSNSTLSLGTFIYHRCGPKKKKKNPVSILSTLAFSCGAAGIVTAAARVTAMMWVPSLAQELSQAMDTTKKKKKMLSTFKMLLNV